MENENKKNFPKIIAELSGCIIYDLIIMFLDFYNDIFEEVKK